MKQKEIDVLVEQLISAEELEKELSQVFYTSDENRKAYNLAHENLLSLQRQIAKLEEVEYCIPLPFDVEWDKGAPSPHLLQNEYKTFLLFYLKEELPDWDGKSVTVMDFSQTECLIAVVEFKLCRATKLGSPNDEVLHGHPLYGKGLDYYSPFIVKNSIWIKEQESINKVHFGYRADFWKKNNHYLFTFHDSTFECIASGFEIVSVLNATMKDAVAHVYEKLF